jgi:hypothetical protein
VPPTAADDRTAPRFLSSMSGVHRDRRRVAVIHGAPRGHVPESRYRAKTIRGTTLKRLLIAPSSCIAARPQRTSPDPRYRRKGGF